MTQAGHKYDPEPVVTLSERGLYSAALAFRYANPCSPCVEVKKWDLLSDMEAEAMGVRPDVDAQAAPHTCDDRDLSFWIDHQDARP